LKQKPFVQQEEIERIQSKLDDTIKRAKDARKKSNMVFDGRWPWRTARENLSDERRITNQALEKDLLAYLK